MLLGQSFYLRSNASVATSQAISETSSIKLNTNDIFRIFGFSENSVLSDHAFSKYDIDVATYSFTPSPNGTIIGNSTVLPTPFVKCNTLDVILTPVIDVLFKARHRPILFKVF